MHLRNEIALYALVAVHLLALAYYAFGKRENLVVPMITGDKLGHDAPHAEDDARTRLRALVLLLLSAALVTYVVGL